MGDTVACRSAFGVGDSFNRQRGCFGCCGAFGQLLYRWYRRIVDFNLRDFSGDFIGAGKPDIGIFRGHLCHCHGPRRQRTDALTVKLAGRNRGVALADKDPQGGFNLL